MREAMLMTFTLLFGLLVGYILGLGDYRDIVRETEHLAKVQSYICAELGYGYAMSYKSKKELFDRIGSIIGERKEN